MARESQLRQLIANIVKDVIAEQQQATINSDPEQGVVIDINDGTNNLPADGTVSVQTGSGNYTGVGTPVPLVIGTQVMVIVADGRRVAVPLGGQPTVVAT